MENFLGFFSFKMGRKTSFSWKPGEKDITKYDIKDNCLRELIEFWVDFNFRDSFLSRHDFCSSMIWNISLVRIANRPFFYKRWAKAGAHYIKDLVNDDFTN